MNTRRKKTYPQGYPINDESIGIEVVGSYNEETKTWDIATEEQKEAYGLKNGDIYEHDKISYKTEGEGAGLYSPNTNNN